MNFSKLALAAVVSTLSSFQAASAQTVTLNAGELGDDVRIDRQLMLLMILELNLLPTMVVQ